MSYRKNLLFFGLFTEITQLIPMIFVTFIGQNQEELKQKL